MNRHPAKLSLVTLALAGGLTFAHNMSPAAFGQEGHESFAAGEPGNPAKPSRVVKVTMLEEGRKKLFDPRGIEVRLGEQIRFLIFNSGTEDHEFILATKADNRKHAALMKKFPDMAHDDPNAVRLPALNSGEILWKFNKRGEFEYASLIPGDLQEGMHGKIIVK